MTFSIQPLDMEAMEAARRRWNGVAKPLNSLGRFEALVTQVAGITRTADVAVLPACVLTFCADNGVVAEGVSQSGQEVTALVAQSLAEGTANVSLMAKAAGADAFCVDMGMAEEVAHPAVIRRGMGRGTANIARGPAMSRETAERAVQAGIDLAGEMKRRGYRALAVGEMGIGNTTTASAVAAALLRAAPEEVTGRGAGLSDAGLARKVRAIHQALDINRPDPEDAIDVLAKVGGFDLAGMAGAFIGGAAYRLPVIADGVISCVAALAAQRLCSGVSDFILPSHQSREPAGRLVLTALGMEPVIHGDMALGEGTGAVMLLPLLDMALRVYHGVHTFDALRMEAYVPQGGQP